MSLKPGDKPLKDADIAMFRPPVQYKPMEMVLLAQNILQFNQASDSWQCDFTAPNLVRCPPGWTLENPRLLNQVMGQSACVPVNIMWSLCLV